MINKCAFSYIQILVYFLLGDLKLVEKPSPLTLAPHDFANIKANVKVASTENGIIFGNIGMVLFYGM
jgi:vesicle coat complex subunit